MGSDNTERTTLDSHRMGRVEALNLLPESVVLVASDRVNAHWRDDHIHLDSVRHVYAYRDSNGHHFEFSTSVSAVWENYFHRFNAEETLESFFDRWALDSTSKYNAQIIAGRAAGKCDNVIKQNIADAWEANGMLARAQGTYMHRQIELALNGHNYDNSFKEMKQFFQWIRDVPATRGWKIFRTEWSVFNLNSPIAGQIDAIFEDKNGKCHMVDWKRCKEVLQPLAKVQFRRFGKYPLHDMVDNAYYHYVLQQNLYSSILLSEYDLSLTSMSLVRFHPDEENYEHVGVPFLREETIRYILHHNKGRLTVVPHKTMRSPVL